MFCQARYEAAKSNERLSSREGAAEEIGIDRTRLARIELGSTIPYQEEVLLMADCYKAPELKGNYCREMCPLGKNMPKIENAGLDRISLRMLSSLKKINEARTVTLKQNEINKYFTPDYDEQKMRTVIIELLEESPEEQEILSNYVGWGGLPDAFDESKASWSEEYQELLPSSYHPQDPSAVCFRSEYQGSHPRSLLKLFSEAAFLQDGSEGL